MKPVRSLRLAAVFSLLFAIAHTFGATSSWNPIPDNDVFRAMNSFRFDVGGFDRSYRELYVGLGLCLALYLFLQAIALWQLATISKTNPSTARPLVASFLIVSLASGFVTWKFIFMVPVVFQVVITLCLAVALLASRSRST